MSAVVTLDIFSGVPNPTWELSDREISQLRELIGRLQNQTLLKTPAVAGSLGYLGFRIDLNRENLDPVISVFKGIVDLERFAPSKFDPDREIERFLLNTGRRRLKANVVDHVEKLLHASARFSAESDIQILAPVPYDPGKWNNDPRVQLNNNCYNYACDVITFSMAQPGKGSGRGFSTVECGDVGSAAVRDGLVATSKPTTTPKDGHYVALVISVLQDFHWYRLDDNHYWSHKRGQYPAKNVDESRSPISDPETCDSDGYAVFCGYYLADPNKITIL